MNILMSGSCAVPESEYPDEALIVLHQSYAELLLKRRLAFQAVQGYDDDLSELVYGGSPCDFVFGYERDEEVEEGAEEDDASGEHDGEDVRSIGEQLGHARGPAEGAEYEILPPEFKPRCTVAATYADCVAILKDGVQFRAVLKHADTDLFTGVLPWDVIEAVANLVQTKSEDE